MPCGPSPPPCLGLSAEAFLVHLLVPQNMNAGSPKMLKTLKKGTKIMVNRGFGASGGHLGAIWGTSGSQGGKSYQKHGSRPSPRVPIWGRVGALFEIFLEKSGPRCTRGAFNGGGIPEMLKLQPLPSEIMVFTSPKGLKMSPLGHILAPIGGTWRKKSGKKAVRT